MDIRFNSINITGKNVEVKVATLTISKLINHKIKFTHPIRRHKRVMQEDEFPVKGSKCLKCIYV